MVDIASKIDHTLLKPEAKKDAIKKLCHEAMEYKFKAVCVNPFYVTYCKEILESSSVEIATVIGFPLGASTTASKAFETEDAIKNGADEIDMVINIGALKDKDYKTVKEDIQAVVESASGKKVKVIIETALLEKDEKIKACELSMDAGASFVKTSTGFSTGGATLEDVELMKEIVGGKLEVKASGGIRDLETAKAMIDKGATRLGASSGVEIIKELEESK